MSKCSIVATTPVTAKHAELLPAFATRTEFRGMRYVMTRDDFGEQPARIVDADGGEIAADYRAWIDAQLAELGSVHEVWHAHKDSGYRLVEIQPRRHYFAHDRGGDPDNFVQLEVWEEQEFVERGLFPRDADWGLPDADELRRGYLRGAAVTRFERRALGAPRYRLQAVTDMARFAAIAETVYRERRQREGDRQFVERNLDTGESRVVSARALVPGYGRQQWRGRRFFDDWAASSAGRAGERACLRWAFATSDYTDTAGVRHLDFIPWWAHTRKLAALKNTGKLDAYSLYGKLVQFDERIGHRFAWYFYGLHGNLVKSGQLERVLEAAEAGLIVLPEHDYQVLRRWGDDSYGF
ncbi:hypothetical protein [Burkholderia ubonensis]|uniref:hypothetical protein n=1 Tax=Burkholderia ubonensis TaxID=101571 RepID=UPI00075CA060|nr:hypothetical protein [Burkholderia ubonensis]AOI68719.1 hypothetical protein WI31_03550 [Burkholderia ubonensis]KUZ15895.1 hypothetical protein WI29_18905 [Burkholderia ubonensis]KUZ24604.1 hypothetical protein WI30_29280 [Burkholderia ubonensis]KUZ38432.1 hypothetical protein WI32_12305 [Burkholderia ubonensis]KUZ46220.1 hypothetical protein WI33_24805 [Burkholderia ubonensis]